MAEVPTIWLERDHGVSNFKIANGFPTTCDGGALPSARSSRSKRSGCSHVRRSNGEHRAGDGSAGFIGGYVVKELLDRGHEVIGLDNYSKYGPVNRSYGEQSGYRFVEGDARDFDLLSKLLAECEHFIGERR